MGLWDKVRAALGSRGAPTKHATPKEMRNYCEFYELHARRSALIDAQSVAELSHCRDDLARPIRSLADAQSLLCAKVEPGDMGWGLGLHKRLLRALRVLSHFIMFDHVAVDLNALRTAGGPGLWSESEFAALFPLLTGTDFPNEAVVKTMRDLISCIKAGLTAKALQVESVPDELWLEKPDHLLDELEKFIEPGRRFHFPIPRPDEEEDASSREPPHLFSVLSELENSGNAPPRAFVYIEAANIGRVPLMLSEAKERGLGEISSAAAWVVSRARGTEALTRIMHALQDRVSAPIASAAQGLQARIMLSLPPIDRYILHLAADRQCSIIEAVAEIRDDDNAVAFRRWLWSVQEAIMAPVPAKVAEAEKILREFEKVADDWGRELDPKLHVRYERRTLNLEAIPTIGFLFKALGGMTVKDPVLNPQRHLAFMSNLFDAPSADRGE